jgi:hypothetical protein
MLLSPLAEREMNRETASHFQLRTRVNEAFLNSPYLALRSLHFEISDDVVVLRGAVPTFYLKQIAQAHAAQVSEPWRIVNEIEVTHNLPRAQDD